MSLSSSIGRKAGPSGQLLICGDCGCELQVVIRTVDQGVTYGAWCEKHGLVPLYGAVDQKQSICTCCGRPRPGSPADIPEAAS